MPDDGASICKYGKFDSPTRSRFVHTLKSLHPAHWYLPLHTSLCCCRQTCLIAFWPWAEDGQHGSPDISGSTFFNLHLCSLAVGILGLPTHGKVQWWSWCCRPGPGLSSNMTQHDSYEWLSHTIAAIARKGRTIHLNSWGIRTILFVKVAGSLWFPTVFVRWCL
jgi:hypothetical protein